MKYFFLKEEVNFKLKLNWWNLFISTWSIDWNYIASYKIYTPYPYEVGPTVQVEGTSNGEKFEHYPNLNHNSLFQYNIGLSGILDIRLPAYQRIILLHYCHITGTKSGCFILIIAPKLSNLKKKSLSTVIILQSFYTFN
jgi:hypothetical protein